MADIQLKANQAALILESSEDGDISVNIALPKDGAEDGVLASALCQVIAQKLVGDDQFQNQILAELDKEEKGYPDRQYHSKSKKKDLRIA